MTRQAGQTVPSGTRAAVAAFRNFDLEVWQSEHEQDVEYELADSGVPAVTLRELEALGFPLDPVLDLPLHYPEVIGTERLRERIAGLYPGLTSAEVLVTVGAAEAGGVVLDALTQPGDRVAFMRPNYQQLPGLALNWDRQRVTFSLDPERGWALRTDELERVCEPGVALIGVCNPNNPTGHVLSGAEREAVVAIARHHDAWLLSDEVYIGTEHDGPETATLREPYEKTVVISSLSKAYGLSGLRLGWVAGPKDAITACRRRHEYATIATAALSMAIAEFALDPAHRAALVNRSRAIIAAGHEAIRDWASQANLPLSVVPAPATPVAFVALPQSVSSIAFARQLVEKASVLVAPGAFFGGFDGHIRVTAARDLGQLRDALDRIALVLAATLAPGSESRETGRVP